MALFSQNMLEMAAELAKRSARFETWDAADPNRKMALEETPWVRAATF